MPTAASAHFHTPPDLVGGTNGVIGVAGSAVRGGGATGGALGLRAKEPFVSRIVGAGGAVGSRTTGAGAAGAGLCVLFVNSFRHSAIVCGRSFSVNASALSIAA